MTLDDDVRWLREAFRLADGAIDAGDQPYGAVLIGAEGEPIGEAVNERERSGDCTRHAELIVASEATRRWSRDELMSSTLYSSAEPCPMCAGAIAWSGIGRLVFGLSQATGYRLWRVQPRFATPRSCRDVLEGLVPPIEVVGPLLEEEASTAHRRWAALQA